MEWYLTHVQAITSHYNNNNFWPPVKKNNLLFAFLAAYCASLSFVTSSSCEIKEKT